MGLGRLALPQPRHQDREQQPVRPHRHQPQGVQEDPETGETNEKYPADILSNCGVIFE